VVIDSLGFHLSCIYDWFKRYRRGGEAGVEIKRIAGQPKRFDDGLWADELRERIRNGPRQLDFHDALRTRATTRVLFKAKVSERTAVSIVTRLDITVRPRRKAVEPKTVRHFPLTLISAVLPMSELRFMVTEQRLNAATFISHGRLSFFVCMIA
jgi:transposase